MSSNSQTIEPLYIAQERARYASLDDVANTASPVVYRRGQQAPDHDSWRPATMDQLAKRHHEMLRRLGIAAR